MVIEIESHAREPTAAILTRNNPIRQHDILAELHIWGTRLDDPCRDNINVQVYTQLKWTGRKHVSGHAVHIT